MTIFIYHQAVYVYICVNNDYVAIILVLLNYFELYKNNKRLHVLVWISKIQCL